MIQAVKEIFGCVTLSLASWPNPEYVQFCHKVGKDIVS